MARWATVSSGQEVTGSDRLNRRQQLTGFLPSAVAARTAFRTMFVDSLRLAGHYAEQSAEILHEPTPDLRRDPQAIDQRSKLFRRRTSLARSSLPSRPVQQGQVLRSRDRQKTFVTAPSALLIQTWTDRTCTSPAVPPESDDEHHCSPCLRRRTRRGRLSFLNTEHWQLNTGGEALPPASEPT